MENAETALARVGGIPLKNAAARHSLGCMITWFCKHVLRECIVRVKVFKDGKFVEVYAGSEILGFRFTAFPAAQGVLLISRNK